MNRFVKFIVPAVLFISFFIIVIVSPGEDSYLSRFGEDEYAVVASFDVPEGENMSLSVSRTNLPIGIGYERKGTGQVRVLVNKSLIRNNSGIAGKIKANLATDAANLTVRLELSTGRLFYFRGEGFNIVNLFDDYKNLFDDRVHPMLVIEVPENYSYPNPENSGLLIR